MTRHFGSNGNITCAACGKSFFWHGKRNKRFCPACVKVRELARYRREGARYRAVVRLTKAYAGRYIYPNTIYAVSK